MEGSDRGPSKVLSQNLPGGTEENNANLSFEIAGLVVDVRNCDLPNMNKLGGNVLVAY